MFWPRGGTLSFDADQRFILGARFAKNYHGAQGLGVQAGDQVGVGGAVFFPELTNLNLRNAHRQTSNVVWETGSVNCFAEASAILAQSAVIYAQETLWRWASSYQRRRIRLTPLYRGVYSN